MSIQRNEFLNPSLANLEYLMTKLRRDDLYTFCDQWIAEGENPTVLDYGSRKALYREIIEGSGAKFITADFSVSTENRDIDICLLENGRIDLPENSVDIVLSLQVLEHVSDVEFYLSEAQRVLKPGGLLWLTTHGMWPYHPTPDDYTRWTIAGLIRLLSQYLSVVDTRAFLGAPAYSFLIFLRLWFLLTRRLNLLQCRVLNRFTGKRWGKDGVPREARIKAHYLYLGNILFDVPAFFLNILIEAIDKATPMKLKRTEAAFFRVAARKIT